LDIEPGSHQSGSALWTLIPLAEGIVLAAERNDRSDLANLGSVFEISIKDLAETILRLTDFRGEIVWDITKPNGKPRRKLDTSRTEAWCGFKASTPFEDGLRRTIQWYLDHQDAPEYSQQFPSRRVSAPFCEGRGT